MKKALFVLFTVFAASSANAQWLAGVNYLSYEDDTFGDISFGVMTGTIGYEYSQETSNITITPEFRLGTGVGEDTYLGVDFSLSMMYSFNLRATWEIAPNAYLYVAPNFTKVHLDIGALEEESDFDFGYGLGVGYAIRDNFKIELTMEGFEGGDTTGFGVRYEF